MKSLVLIFAVLLGTILHSSMHSLGQTPSELTNDYQFQASSAGFSYPSGWEILTDQSSIFISDNHAFFSLSDPEILGRAGISADETTSLRTVIEADLPNYLNEFYTDSLPEFDDTFFEIQETIDSREYTLFTDTHDNIELIYGAIRFSNGEIGSLVGSYRIEDRDGYRALAQMILQSFDIIEPIKTDLTPKD